MSKSNQRKFFVRLCGNLIVDCQARCVRILLNLCAKKYPRPINTGEISYELNSDWLNGSNKKPA